jgi:hypothetical protein
MTPGRTKGAVAALALLTAGAAFSLALNAGNISAQSAPAGKEAPAKDADKPAAAVSYTIVISGIT